MPKAIEVPSGEKPKEYRRFVGGRWVICLRPVPSEPTVNRLEFVNVSLSLLRHRIRLPSGDQLGPSPECSCHGVIRCRPRPFALTMKMAWPPAGFTPP